MTHSTIEWMMCALTDASNLGCAFKETRLQDAVLLLHRDFFAASAELLGILSRRGFDSGLNDEERLKEVDQGTTMATLKALAQESSEYDGRGPPEGRWIPLGVAKKACRATWKSRDQKRSWPSCSVRWRAASTEGAQRDRDIEATAGAEKGLGECTRNEK